MVSACRCASDILISAVYSDGMDIAVTLSGPNASTARASVRAESIPPDNPITQP